MNERIALDPITVAWPKMHALWLFWVCSFLSDWSDRTQIIKII